MARGRKGVWDGGPWTGPASGRSRPSQLARCAVDALLGLASPLQCGFPGDAAGLTDKPISVVRGTGAGRRRCPRKHSARPWVPSHVYVTHKAHAESTGAAMTVLAGPLGRLRLRGWCRRESLWDKQGVLARGAALSQRRRLSSRVRIRKSESLCPETLSWWMRAHLLPDVSPVLV